jgi:hypothetical protein
MYFPYGKLTTERNEINDPGAQQILTPGLLFEQTHQTMFHLLH